MPAYSLVQVRVCLSLLIVCFWLHWQVRNYAELGGLISTWDAVTHTTGWQRVGMLYGRYAEDPNFHGGVKAVIEAIYEPPQSCDGSTGVVTLHLDPRAKAVAAGA